MARAFNVLALLKGNDHYVYVYDDASSETLIAAFRDQAANPHLSLTWFDASVLTERVRDQERSATSEVPVPAARF